MKAQKPTLEQLRALHLHELKQNFAYRQRDTRQQAQQVEQVIDGKKFINFSSNDYLGLANHPEVRQAFKNGVDKWGTGSGAADLINGHSQAHQALEEELAEFTGRDRALLFSTGYMANLAIHTALYDEQVTLYQDKLNHASLIDGALASKATLKRYRHCHLEHLSQLIQKQNTPYGAIISDSVFSMDGDIAPLDQLSKLAAQNSLELVVDDAHGFGVLGKNGAGSASHFNLDQQQLPVLMATLGKAAGCFGAFVAGSETLIETLINRARSYIFTTATPAALAEATRSSIKVMQKETWRQQKLHELIAHFQQQAKHLDLPLLPSPTAIQPIILADNDRVMQMKSRLHQNGFLVGAVRHPTVPDNSARLRITLSAEHHNKQIDDLLQRIRHELDETLAI